MSLSLIDAYAIQQPRIDKMYNNYFLKIA